MEACSILQSGCSDRTILKQIAQCRVKNDFENGIICSDQILERNRPTCTPAVPNTMT